jgi:4'-phosphopantetheinyl transferase EntD
MNDRQGSLGPVWRLACAARNHALLPPGSSACFAPISDRSNADYPDEARTIIRAVPKRKREFVSGRACARAALAGLGCRAQSIAAGPDRAPIWPDGYVGSISHTSSLCLAVAGRSSDFLSIGVDLEPNTPLDLAVARSILSVAEWRDIESDLGLAKMVFVAKEAVYKAYYPLTKTFLHFTDVSIRVSQDRNSLTAWLRHPTKPLPGGQRVFSGRFLLSADHCFALVAIQA